MIYNAITDVIGNTPFVYLNRLFPQPNLDVIARLEFLNPGGSVKDRPARFIIERGLQDGTIGPGSHIVESTSGNLGIALAMVSKVYGLKFTAVVDPKISPTNLRIIQGLGANVDMVRDKDHQGGYLHTRIARVNELISTIPNSIWINQYANSLNWESHYQGADEIIRDVGRDLDCVVLAVSTTGTINGISRKLKEHIPNLRVVAVDAVGSVIFGTPPGPRDIPGIGASRVPELFSPKEIDEVIHVDDLESADACRELAQKEGIFAGGSSGSVIAAIQKKLIPSGSKPYRILTLFPDRGERYLDSVYNDEWYQKIAQQKVEV